MDFTITLDGLEETLRRLVREEVAALQPDEWLSHEQAAALLGITPGHLHNLRGIVPSYKPGGRRRYRRSEIEAYMEARR